VTGSASEISQSAEADFVHFVAVISIAWKLSWKLACTPSHRGTNTIRWGSVPPSRDAGAAITAIVCGMVRPARI
jgi:hypothetical protein